MDIAIEIDADDAPPLLADAEVESIPVECFAPKRFGGAAELAVLVLLVATATLRWITKIVLAQIAANRYVKVKVNGIEIQGLSARDTKRLLEDLLASDDSSPPVTRVPSSQKACGRCRMPKSPEAYLAATRRLRDEFIPHGYYAQLHDRICAAMGGFAPLPGLHVTYSTERTCETLELADGRIIIYDQYLGQTFNQLNRLHLNGRDPNDMTTYGCKLLAERLQLIGCLEQSLALAATYRIRQHEAVNSFREDRDLKQRLQWTLIQESFVVVHELFHNVLHRDRAWRADAIRDARGDFYTNRLLPQTQRANRR
jgi:hypothetical protein